MSKETQAVATKNDEKFTEFIPFGAQDKVKLSIAMVKNLVAIKTKQGKTCSDTDAIKFIAMCQARRLNPFEGDAFLIGYDGKEGPTFSLITAHQAFLKRAELNSEYDGMKSGIIVQDEQGIKDLEGDFYLEGQQLLGGWATVYFKNRKQPMHKRIRLQRFQKSWGIWQDDPAGMICKCAEADALRSSFPTMLGGLYLKEEVQNETQPKVSAPLFTAVPSEPATTTTVEVQPEPTKAEPLPSTAIKELRKRMEKEKVSETALVEFLTGLGVVENCKSLEEVHAASDTAIAMVTSQWDDLVKRMKEETQ